MKKEALAQFRANIDRFESSYNYLLMNAGSAKDRKEVEEWKKELVLMQQWADKAENRSMIDLKCPKEKMIHKLQGAELEKMNFLFKRFLDKALKDCN